MEDFDNAKTKDLNECVVTDLNGYLTYISDIENFWNCARHGTKKSA